MLKIFTCCRSKGVSLRSIATKLPDNIWDTTFVVKDQPHQQVETSVPSRVGQNAAPHTHSSEIIGRSTSSSYDLNGQIYEGEVKRIIFSSKTSNYTIVSIQSPALSGAACVFGRK